MTGTAIPMPGMAAIAETDQWQAESMQVVNWGGFEGYHQMPLDVASTLLTGASGTGKSTLLDGYIALMMDSNTPLNGASNDNATGRARSSDRRNVFSYTRGKINTSRDPVTGQARDEMLRGTGTIWSAVAMTWIRDSGDTVTAMRLYLVPASAAGDADLRQHLAIYPGRFHLAALDTYAEHNFHHTRVKAQFPDLTFHDSYSKFAAALHKRLSIGTNGDGAAAMKLLARIQGGRQVASVDGLYKDMVLETPSTYDAADKAIDHFDVLEAAYATMQTAEEQVAMLRTIGDTHDALRKADAEADLIDTFRVGEDPLEANTPLALWRFETEAALIDAEITGIRLDLEEAEAKAVKARDRRDILDGQLTENRRLQWENGGDLLATVERELTVLKQKAEAAGRAREKFVERIEVLGQIPASADQFASMRTAATEFLTGYGEAAAEIDGLLRAHTMAMVPVLDEQKTLREEQTYLTGRRDLIPRELHETRLAVAEAVGMAPDDLPYVAELIDLHPDYENWRLAAELVLGGYARTMLVNRSAGKEFRARINPLRLGPRLNFDLVAADQPLRGLDERLLPGRLMFRDESPFTGWLAAHLGQRFGYECVPDPSGFADDGARRVTLTGQVQDGTRGAHGGHGRRYILGFSSARRLAEVTERLVEVEQALTAMDRTRGTLQGERRHLDALRDAHQYLTDTDWADIDTATAQAAHTRQAEERDRLLAGSDVLNELKTAEQTLTADLESERRDLTTAENAIGQYRKAWGDLATREDEVKTRLEDLADVPTAALSDGQRERLALEYDETAINRNHGEFASVARRVRARLAEQVARARHDVATYADALTTVFTSFQARWPRPNLGAGVESYAGYQEILDDLIAEGLSDRREGFRDQVIEWSGEDLLSLHRAFTEAVEEIETRLVPVNEILAGLPFGPGKDRLRITLRQMPGKDIQMFRGALRTLASNTTTLTSMEAVEARFADLQRFMKRIRKPEKGAGGSERDYLLDVRRHVHVEAERLDAATGTQVGIYDTLGNKSGGETQELIAFIVGAALRYQLGNENSARPIYAPVFLDEGFVKADSEFAGRAVDAWRGLGFQLIVGAPMDKASAIEPCMDRILMVTKTARGYSHLHDITPATAAAGPGNRP